MGSRDYRKREQKKPGKSARKLPSTSVVVPAATVEVVKKGKKFKGEEEPQEGE